MSKLHRLLPLLLLALAVTVTGCKKDDFDVNDGKSAEQLYQEAKIQLDKSNWTGAVRAYKALQTRYPFGRYAEQAQLEMAYAFYKAGQPEHALSTTDRFIRMYPTHPNIDYAYYIRGLTNYDQRVGFLERMMPSRVRDRDQSAAYEAFQDFDELCRRFPDSRYAPDATRQLHAELEHQTEDVLNDLHHSLRLLVQQTPSSAHAQTGMSVNSCYM